MSYCRRVCSSPQRDGGLICSPLEVVAACRRPQAVSSSDENQVVCRTLRRGSYCWPTALVSLLSVRQSKRGHRGCVECRQQHGSNQEQEEKGLDHRITEPQAFLSCNRWGLAIRLVSMSDQVLGSDCRSMPAAQLEYSTSTNQALKPQREALLT